MIRSTLLGLGLLLSAPAFAQDVGTQMPPGVRLERWTQSQATEYGDLFGRAVLIEFFAYWCGPCGAQVAHLNELHEAYAEKGLTVVAVTSDKPKKTERWMKQRDAAYAYAYDFSGDLHSFFGIKSIPHAVLVAPSGAIVWRGHPGRLATSTIEKYLEGALKKPTWEWAPETEELQAALKEGALADAVRLARLLPVEYGDYVRELVALRMAAVEEAYAGGNYLAALNQCEALHASLEGLPQQEAAGELLARIRNDDEATRVMQGQKRLAELTTKASSAETRSQAQLLIGDLRKLGNQFPNTAISARSRAEIERLLKRMRNLR